MKLHFTRDDYDYFRSGGKGRAKVETFRTRHDAMFYDKLARHPDGENMLLANFLKNPKVWIRNILEESGQDIYTEWKKTQDSLGHVFKTDLGKLNDNYQSNFEVHGGQHPYVLTLYLQKEITLETFTILAHFSKVYDYWNENIVDKIIARDIIKLARKYRPFLQIDEKRFSKIVRDRFF